MLATDPSPKVREQVIFAIAQSERPAAMEAVIDAARNHNDTHIRSRALFWIARKAAGKQAQEVIGNAVLHDPDRAVREQAVFALKQLPENRGVPLPIDVAKTNSDPSIRKKAMFWLGQSKDPRALDFFAQVLKP
jgi:HEAT repeat protein